jgi:IS5 family transposase
VAALPGNPYDGHTLEEVIPAITKQIGASLTRGDRRRGISRPQGTKGQRGCVYTSGQKREVKRELHRRRAAVEPAIGHLKEEHRIGHILLAGQAGGSGRPVRYNVRLLLLWLAELWQALMALNDEHPSASGHTPPEGVLHRRLPTQ